MVVVPVVEVVGAGGGGGAEVPEVSPEEAAATPPRERSGSSRSITVASLSDMACVSCLHKHGGTEFFEGGVGEQCHTGITPSSAHQRLHGEDVKVVTSLLLVF